MASEQTRPAVPLSAASTAAIDLPAGAGRARLLGVRAERHRDFDRLAFELAGGRPGHRVEYVPRRPAAGPAAPRGRALLRILLTGADGTPAAPLPRCADFAAFREFSPVEAAAGAADLGAGVAARTGLRVAVTGPGLVVDVMHAPPGTGSALLRRGDRSAAVATWQWRLAQALGRDLRVDEGFGPATEEATRDFQAAARVLPDGLVGPVTRAAMERALEL